MILIND